jgi:hypothetical protein
VVETLQGATRALGRSLCEDDDAGVASALEQREAALAQLAELGPLDPSLEPLLREVQRLDAEVLAEARNRLASVRAELEQIGRARRVVRSLQPGESAARFVSERV